MPEGRFERMPGIPQEDKPEMDPGKQERSPEERSPDATFTRHSASYYQSEKKHLESDDPTAPFNPEDQVVPDLPEKGVALAQEKANEYFDQRDPNEDALFFVSSNESRALGIPCVVGCLHAMQVLDDGDEVEVDANRGFVRVLK